MLPSVMVLGTTQTASRPRGLFIDAQDMVMRVPLESISLTEMGPGGVSSLQCEVDDPLLAVTIAIGSEVRMFDAANAVPDFLGFVQAVDEVVAFGMQGRSWRVTAVGVETVLDRAVLVSDLVFAANAISANLLAAFQSVPSAAVGLGPIRTFGSNGQSTQALPIGAGDISLSTTSNALTIAKGTTVREALRLINANIIQNNAGDPPYRFVSTVDFTYGLRIATAPIASGGIFGASDYGALIVNNTTGVDIYSAALDYALDGSGDVHQVLVVGTGISALVSDGSGLPGQVAVLQDTTITTLAMATSAGNAYLGDFWTTVRGSLQVIDTLPLFGSGPRFIRAGGEIRITDTRIPLAASSMAIMQIDKTFHPLREDWMVTFGGTAPRASSLIRRLTRSTLS